MRFLFILKKRDAAWGVYSEDGYKLPSGLRNSVHYTVQMLHKLGFSAHVVEVHDANCIDREVTFYKPDVACIEALWVLPSKFVELQSLWRHRHVHWMVRSHSEMPFAAMETFALSWIAGAPRDCQRVCKDSDGKKCRVERHEAGWPTRNICHRSSVVRQA